MEIIEQALKEFREKKDRWVTLKATKYKAYSALVAAGDGEKLDFILGSVDLVLTSKLQAYNETEEDELKLRAYIGKVFMEQLLKTRLILSADGLIALCDAFSKTNPYEFIFQWPIGSFLVQIEQNNEDAPLSDKLRSRLEVFKNKLAVEDIHDRKMKSKALTKLDSLLFVGGDGSVRPLFFPNTERFGKYANEVLKAMQGKEQGYWFEAMALVQNTSGGKPTEKFIDAGKVIIEKIGEGRFWEVVSDWFIYPDALSTEAVKGYVWLCSLLQDRSVLLAIATLAERSYEKIPGRGPAGVAVGNACFYVLAHAKGLEGIGHLSRLKMKIKQSSAEKLIDKYLEEAAKSVGNDDGSRG